MIATKEHFVSEEAYAEYERAVDLFYDQLVRLNTTVFILEKIFAFPFELFAQPGQTTFLHMTVLNFFDAAILLIAKVATDNENGYGFRRFQKRLSRNLIKPECRADLYKHLSLTKDYKISDSLLNRVERVRDRYVAHMTEHYIQNGFLNFDPVDLQDLIEIQDKLNLIFHVIRLKEGSCSMLPIDYSPIVFPRRASDIEQILDGIVKESAVLCLPEEQPEFWELSRRQYSVNDIAQLNHYRHKFGLSEIS